MNFKRSSECFKHYRANKDYIKYDGTVGQSTYYPIEFKNCDGNQPENEDYDPNKPCSDCDEGDPVKNPQIQQQTTDCGIQGGMFGYTRGVEDGCSFILHQGVDIKNEDNDPVYAMFNGIATLHEQAGGAGYFVKIKSQIGGVMFQKRIFK